MNIAAGATVTISGFYTGWDSVKVNGGETLDFSSGSVTFSSGEGGEFIITTAGTQSAFTVITVTF